MSGSIDLAEAIRRVDRELAAAEAKVGSYRSDPSTYHGRHRSAMSELSKLLETDLGARISDRWDGVRVRIAGISSTCTAGLSGALHNWLRAARARCGA